MDHIKLDAEAMEVKALLTCYLDELRMAQPSNKWLTKAMFAQSTKTGLKDLIDELQKDVDSNHKRKEVVRSLSKVEQWIYKSSKIIIEQQKKIDSLNIQMNKF